MPGARRTHCGAFRILDASVGASGPHDFAVRTFAPSSIATASRRRVCDDRETPSSGAGRRTTQITLIPKVIFSVGRNGFALAATFEGEFSSVTGRYAGKGAAR
jgi:hypothetical protein